VAGPVVWNSLPAAVRHADGLHFVKLKSHLLPRDALAHSAVLRLNVNVNVNEKFI